MYLRRMLVVCLFVSAGATHLSANDNWPQWRGPTLDSRTDCAQLPLTWTRNENIVWKTPLPAWSAATPIVFGDRVFVVSPTAGDGEAGEDEVARTLRQMDRRDPGGNQIMLHCLARDTGKELWKRPIGTGNTLFGKHNMASPSPVTNGRQIVTLTGTGILTGFDYEGKQLWQHDLQKKYGAFGLGWGYASSPLLHDDKVIVEVLHQTRGKSPSYLAAFDPASGKVLWRALRESDAQWECPDAYTTPTVLKYDDRAEIIVSGADCVTAHDPKTGYEVWRAAGLNPEKRKNYRICGSPTVAGDVVFCTSRRRPVIAVRGGGKGDVTSSHTLWTFSERRGGPDVPSAISDGKYLYMVDDRGIASCLDATNGKRVWGPERTVSGTVSASPLLTDGRWYITNESGVTTVLKTGPQFEILATNDLEDVYTIASLAAARDQLFIRTSDAVYCIADKAKQRPQ